MTLLDTCYLSSGFGAPPEGVQVRYSDGTAERWAERAGAGPAAIHSVRAVPRDQLHVFKGRDPLHVHLSEQVAENEACLAAYGVTPTRLLHDEGLLGPATTVVHATHLTDEDIALLGETRTNVCVTPTTERDLADGIGPARRLYDAGCRISIGSDSHAVVDPFEELRGLEMDERLATQERGHWTAAELLGHRHRRRVRSRWASRPTWSPSTPASPRTAGTGADEHTAVVRRDGRRRRPGRVRRSGRVHQGRRGRDRPRARRGDRRSSGDDQPAWSPTSASSSPTTPSATGCSAWSPTPRWSSRAARSPGSARPPRRRPPTRRSTRSAGRCSPGSSTATATWSSPATGRRSSRPGWPGRRTPRAGSAPRSRPPAQATDEQLTAHVARHVAEMRRQGTTTVEIKSGYGLTVLDEARSLAVARQFTDETTFLGAHVVPAEYAEDPAGYVDLVTGPMLEAAAPHARWVDVFCETGAFDADQARAVLAAGAAKGLRGRLHANQLGPGPGVRLAAELGPRRGRPLHLPRRRRRRRAPRLGHDRHAAARRRVLDPPALPRRPPPARRRRPRRPGQRLQPRLQLHQLGPALHRAGGPGDGHDPRRGRPRRDVRRRPGARPRRRRRAGAREARRLRAAGRPEPRPSGLSTRGPAGRRAPGSAAGRPDPVGEVSRPARTARPRCPTGPRRGSAGRPGRSRCRCGTTPPLP